MPANTVWLDRFPELQVIADPGWKHAAAHAQTLRVKRGYVLFRQGSPCSAFVLVAAGSVRVLMADAEGHEILLYRIRDRQSCMLTTTCLLAGEEYPAAGIAEIDTELVMLPAESFHMAWNASKGFRSFAMNDIRGHVHELMALIGDVAFGRMNVRLARLLLQRQAEILRVTHQELAVELGTAREVVSRVLKGFERRGLIAAGRGRITIVNRLGLESLCDIVTENINS
jgi:cAMP-binding proteins - catabolite gene activator and regulatory subunit of cAMP-dependent protein kinases